MVMMLQLNEHVKSGLHSLTSGNFVLEDEERSGAQPEFEDEELEECRNDDPSQTQEKLAEILRVTEPAISQRLKEMEMIRKVGNWVPYKLKPRHVERRLFTYEQLLQRQKKKGFTYGYLTMPKPNIHGQKITLCIWWNQVGVVYCELLKSKKRSQGRSTCDN